MATIDDLATQVTNVSEKLAAHERIMEDRYEHLEKGHTEIKSAIGAKETGMSEVKNIFETNPMNSVLPLLAGGGWGNNNSGLGGAGGGLGGGFIGAALGSALLGNGGLLNNNRNQNGEGIVTPSQFQAGLNSVTAASDTTAIMQGIADIKAAVPLAEGQTQIALQSAQADLNRNIDSTGDQITAQVSAAQLANANNFAATSRQLSDIIATSLASQNAINQNISNQGSLTREVVNSNGTANLLATERAAAATALAVANSTKEILAALTAQNMADLQRQLTVAESALSEQRSVSRSREVEVNVTQSVTQNQNQLNSQNQQQQQFQIMAQLAATMNNLANDIQQVKQSSIVFNSGRMSDAGNQSAQNTRVA